MENLPAILNSLSWDHIRYPTPVSLFKGKPFSLYMSFDTTQSLYSVSLYTILHQCHNMKKCFKKQQNTSAWSMTKNNIAYLCQQTKSFEVASFRFTRSFKNECLKVCLDTNVVEKYYRNICFLIKILRWLCKNTAI